MENMIDSLDSKVSKCDTNIGKDGLEYCNRCGGCRQTKLTVAGREKIVWCACDCLKAETEKQARQDRKAKIDRRRKICFGGTNMAHWNFENSDRKNPKVDEAMKEYAKNFEEFKRQGKGLLLYGTVGTGKTYYAACIANALLDEGHRVLMTNFAQLTNTIQGMFEGKQEFINSLNSYSLLIIDDLGAERTTEYMQEMVFNIIDSRYRAGKPMIITTNLTLKEITKAQDIGRDRIYDRILERCHPIEVQAENKRVAKARAGYVKMQELLGSQKGGAK